MKEPRPYLEHILQECDLIIENFIKRSVETIGEARKIPRNEEVMKKEGWLL